MTHEHECYVATSPDDDEAGCICLQLRAHGERVRADEREKARQRVEALIEQARQSRDWRYDESYLNGLDDAAAAAGRCRMSIQRWNVRITETPIGPKPWHDKADDGEWVRYDDHVAALRACEQRAYALGIEVGKHDGWLAGHAAGVVAARDAVAALSFDPLSRDQGPAATQRQALAAIDALKEKS